MAKARKGARKAARKGAKAPLRRAARPAPRRARKRVEPVPKAYGSITPGLSVRGGADAIDFYARAFGAEEIYRMPGPDGKVMHAELRFGDSIVMLGDEEPGMGASSPETLGGSTVSLLFYVPDVDAAYARAVAAGATSVQGPADMFWGDRFAQVRDPFGHRWSIGTHVADLTPEQIQEGMEAWMASRGRSGG